MIFWLKFSLFEWRLWWDLQRLKWRLRDFYEPEDALLWIYTPNPVLGGATPFELVMQGRKDLVHQKLTALEYGAFI